MGGEEGFVCVSMGVPHFLGLRFYFEERFRKRRLSTTTRKLLTPNFVSKPAHNEALMSFTPDVQNLFPESNTLILVIFCVIFLVPKMTI